MHIMVGTKTHGNSTDNCDYTADTLDKNDNGSVESMKHIFILTYPMCFFWCALITQYLAMNNRKHYYSIRRARVRAAYPSFWSKDTNEKPRYVMNIWETMFVQYVYFDTYYSDEHICDITESATFPIYRIVKIVCANVLDTLLVEPIWSCDSPFPVMHFKG